MLDFQLAAADETTKHPEVTNITFAAALDREYHRPSSFDAVDHEEIAEELSSSAKGFASVIIVCQRLKDSLWDDPEHMHIKNDIVVSEVQREARTRLMNRYYSQDELQELIEKFELKTWKQNYGSDKEDEDHKFKIAVEDALFQQQELLAMFDVMGELREQCWWDYDEDTDEERKRTEEEFQAEWDRVKVEKTVPGVWSTYDRVYAMPTPFDHWDYRNRFQQWYFIHTDTGIGYRRGGSGSSGQREDQGRYAHVFATLTTKFGKSIPTYILEYTETNELVLVRQYDMFRAVDQELTGNYHADYRGRETVFRGMLLHLNHETGALSEKPVERE